MGIIPSDTYDQRIQKSIEAYYLDRYYEQLKEFTFKTFFYPITTTLEDAIPAILPFEKNFVKYSNKSPKDSDFWGPVTTKEEVVNVFYTSLRCKRQVSNVLCIREWSCVPILEEYRCFWNRRLVAISVQRDIDRDDERSGHFGPLIDYIQSLPVVYYRSVFDIAKLEDGSFKFIEMNSWETNSGGHNFDWHDDHEILYDVDGCTTVIRATNSQCTVQSNLPMKLPHQGILFHKKPDDMTILVPSEPSCWLVTENYIYICNDKYLGRFNKNLEIINWKVGNFRFGALEMINGDIYINDYRFHYDLTPLKVSDKHSSGTCPKPSGLYWYGFDAVWDNKKCFCRMHYSGVFEAVYL